MTNHVTSLHARLLIVIIAPLLFIVALMTVARYYEAQQTSQKIYDNSLISIAHVVARDVVLNSGDLIAKRLLATLTEALGDQLFYYVIGDNTPTLLSGYTPHPKPNIKIENSPKPYFFNSKFRGEIVRVVTLREYFTTPHYEGWVTITLWQNTHQRDNLSFSLASRAFTMMILMIIATAIVVWLGVNYGLRPLLDLQDAIEKRSPDDISPIKRAVPREALKLVSSMNTLFKQLSESFAEKDAFIANAAHQLRNPIAGLLSQAEAAERNKDPQQQQQRVADVAEAARRTARLTDQLLSMERVSKRSLSDHFKTFDISNLLRETLARTASRAFAQNVELSLEGADKPIMLQGNATLIGEVLDNLLDNALRYGCLQGDKIETILSQSNTVCTITLADNGQGIDKTLLPRVFERFTRGVEDGADGCGLGLAIAQSIVIGHGGMLSLNSDKHGTTATLSLPVT